MQSNGAQIKRTEIVMYFIINQTFKALNNFSKIHYNCVS